MRRRALGTLVALIIIFVIAGAIVVAFSSQPVTESMSTIGATTSESAGHAGPPSIYPNPSLTPGDTVTGIRAAQVCTPGYSTSVRNVTRAEKVEVFRRYNEPDIAGRYEVDHFISLELGGSNNVTNLWPEPYTPTPGAHQKDKVENYLHSQVCKGALTLAQAQEAIRSDWYAVYLRIGG